MEAPDSRAHPGDLTIALSPCSKRSNRTQERRISPEAWASLSLLGLASLCLWIIPIFVPWGQFLWGHYRLSDILLGVPLGLAEVLPIVRLSRTFGEVGRP